MVPLNRKLITLVTLLLATTGLAGCLKGDEVEAESLEQTKADVLLGDDGRDRIVEAAAVIPKNYTFPGQDLLETVETVFAGTASSEALGSYEAERDQGGIDYRTVKQMYDISNLVPPGQPVELVVDLIWDAAEVNSADLDIVINVPGTQTDHSPVSETFNWNLAVKTMVVNTVGVSGQPAEVGVQIASGAVTQGFDYTLEVKASYAKDVLTPHHAWAFDVPSGASGIILESEKAGGDEHLTSEFIVIGPDDNLVQFVDFNDIDIPTQSVFIPTNTPGEYVFYAYYMHGGFFRLKADVPLQEFNVRPLTLTETRVVDQSGLAPGVAGKDYLNGTADGTVPSEDHNPTTVEFSPEGPFPLRVTAFIEGQVSTMAKIRLTSPKGEVHEMTSIARYEDERGSIGYTSDHEGGANNQITWQNIAKGTWQADIVNDSPSVELGHVVLSYTR